MKEQLKYEKIKTLVDHNGNKQRVAQHETHPSPMILYYFTIQNIKALTLNILKTCYQNAEVMCR